MILSIMTLSLTLSHYAECRVSFIVMLSLVMLSLVMLSVIMLSVIMINVIVLNVVAPTERVLAKRFKTAQQEELIFNLRLEGEWVCAIR